jgi:hypothetical protein
MPNQKDEYYILHTHIVKVIVSLSTPTTHLKKYKDVKRYTTSTTTRAPCHYYHIFFQFVLQIGNERAFKVLHGEVLNYGDGGTTTTLPIDTLNVTAHNV